MKAHCFKCKAKTHNKDEVPFVAKNGTPMVKSKCTVCGTGQCQIVKK